MREIEKDGFITREEDLMMSERTAKPVTECDYPKCDGCDKYVDGYCTVPMVVTKQIYRFTAERIAQLEKSVTELEKLVMDEILGEESECNSCELNTSCPRGLGLAPDVCLKEVAR